MNRQFFIQYCKICSQLHQIGAGVLQSSFLGPYFYLLYTSNLLSTSEVEVATFTDDATLLAPHSNYNIATTVLQNTTDTLANQMPSRRPGILDCILIKE